MSIAEICPAWFFFLFSGISAGLRPMLRWLAIIVRQQLAVDQTLSTASAADRQRSSAMGSVVPSLVWPVRITTYRSAGDHCTVVSPRRSIDAKTAAKMGNNWRAFANQTFIVPFAAIIQGRKLPAPGEIGWWRICGGGRSFQYFSVFLRPTVQRISDRRNLRVSV